MCLASAAGRGREERRARESDRWSKGERGRVEGDTGLKRECRGGEVREIVKK